MHSVFQQQLLNHPILITGSGSICGAGASGDELWQATLRGKSQAEDREGTAVCPLDEEALAKAPRRAKRMDVGTQMAAIAALEAASSAGLDSASPSRIGVVTGTSRGPMRKWIEAEQRHQSGRRMLPSLSAHSTVSCTSGLIAQELGAGGPSMTLSATCASAAVAIATAAEQILLGKADIVLAGGADRGTDQLVVEQMRSARVLGSHLEDPSLACRPFDRDRTGMVLGDGAGFLVLESAASAAARGAVPMGMLRGWASATGSAGRSAVEADGSVLAGVLQEALALAEASPSEVGYINAHGTGTTLNDLGEVAAYRRVLGRHASTCPISSTKPVTGHCLGATGALEALLCLKALQHGLAPPTAGLTNPDPKFAGLRLVQNEAVSLAGKFAVSCSSGFWSKHAALVFSAK